MRNSTSPIDPVATGAHPRKRLFGLLFLLCCLYSMPLHAQYFQESIDIFDQNDARSVVATPDGGFALTGLTEQAGRQRAFLLKTDFNGEEEWLEVFDFGAAVGNAVQSAVGGGYVLAGRGASGIAASTNGLLLKTDASGAQQWARLYGGSGPDEFHAVTEVVSTDITDPVRYVAAGVSFSGSSRDMYIVKADPMGNQLDARVYDFGLSESAESIISVPGGFLVCGSSNLGFTGYTNIIIMKVDRHLNLLWAKSYGGALDEDALSLTNTADGNAVMAGYSASYTNGKKDILAMKIDTGDGSVMWSRIYGRGSDEFATSVTETADGGLVFTGGIKKNASTPQDVFLMKTDGAGNLLWDVRFGGKLEDVGSAIDQAPDGGFVVAGERQTPISSVDGDFRNAYLIKTDLNGDSACESALTMASVAVPVSGFDFPPTVAAYGSDLIGLQTPVATSSVIRSLCCDCDDVEISFASLSTTDCLHPGDSLRLINTSDCAERFGWVVNGTLVSTDEDFVWSPDAPGTYTIELYGKLKGCPIQSASATYNVFPTPGCYCRSRGMDSLYYISTFCFTDICYGSGNDGGYAFFPFNFTAGKGDTIYVSAVQGVTVIPNQFFWRLWIDYDRDGQFEPLAGELAFDASGIGPVSGFFVVPNSAQIGQTLMRLQMKRVPPFVPGTPPGPCEEFAEGEVEDYLLTILGPSPTPRVSAMTGERLLTVFPNPASDHVTVRMTGPTAGVASGPAFVELYDARGVRLQSAPVDLKFGVDAVLNTDDLAPGVYTVLVRGEGLLERRQVVIAR